MLFLILKSNEENKWEINWHESEAGGDWSWILLEKRENREKSPKNPDLSNIDTNQFYYKYKCIFFMGHAVLKAFTLSARVVYSALQN